MNISHLLDRTVRRAFAVGSRGHREEDSFSDDQSVEELDADGRNWLVVLISLLLAMGFAAVFFLGSSTRDPGAARLEPAGAAPPVTANTADEHLTLGMMLAPGTTVSKRVAGAPGAVAGDVMMALPPAEPLAELAHTLSPEWRLAMQPASAAQIMERPRATLSLGTERPALPAPETSEVAAVASSIASRLEGMMIAENRIENGIGVRIFRTTSLPLEAERVRLAEELATCRAQGFIAGESCRHRVCNGFRGKVPECPFQDVIGH